MISDYQKELLEVMKEYDPEEYKVLTTKCDKTIAEEHLDELAAQFPTIEAYKASFSK